MLPGVVKFGFYSRFRASIVLDGGITCPIPYLNKDSNKIFLNILPEISLKWPFVREQISNL